MPYQTHTNDSDAQFAAQIDRYKLGPGVSPGGSAFWASEAAMNALGNDEMNVARLMQARAALHSNSMATRKEISSDLMNKKASDDYEDYSRFMQEGSSDDFEANARLRRDAAARWGDDERVNRSLGSHSAADEGILSGRRFNRENKILAVEEENWEKDLEMELEQKRQKSENLRLAGIQLDIDADIVDDQVFGSLARGAGGLMERNPKLAGKIVRVSNRLDTGTNKDFDTARRLNLLTNVYSRQGALESYYGNEISGGGGIQEVNKLIGKDLSSATTAEEYDEMLKEVAVKSAGQNDTEKANTKKALDLHAEFMKNNLLRKKLGDDIEAHLDAAPANISSDEWVEWKGGLKILEMEANYLNGNLNSKANEVVANQQKELNAYEYRKLQAEELERDQKNTFDAEDQDLQKRQAQWDIDKVSRAEQFRILMLASKGKENMSEPDAEKLINKLTENWKKNPASKAPGSLYGPR